jgi:hypothetical protein
MASSSTFLFCVFLNVCAKHKRATLCLFCDRSSERAASALLLPNEKDKEKEKRGREMEHARLARDRGPPRHRRRRRRSAPVGWHRSGAAGPFDLLPDELVMAVLRWAQCPRTVARFGATCLRLRAIASDAPLWPAFGASSALADEQLKGTICNGGTARGGRSCTGRRATDGRPPTFTARATAAVRR